MLVRAVVRGGLRVVEGQVAGAALRIEVDPHVRLAHGRIAAGRGHHHTLDDPGLAGSVLLGDGRDTDGHALLEVVPIAPLGKARAPRLVDIEGHRPAELLLGVEQREHQIELAGTARDGVIGARAVVDSCVDGAHTAPLSVVFKHLVGDREHLAHTGRINNIIA